MASISRVSNRPEPPIKCGMAAHRLRHPLERLTKLLRCLVGASETGERARRATERHRKRRRATPVDRRHDVLRPKSANLGDRPAHELLHRSRGVQIGTGGNAERGGDREHPRMLPAAVVVKDRNGRTEPGRGLGVERRVDSALKRGRRKPEPGEQALDESRMPRLATVTRGDDRQRLAVRSEPIESATPHDRRRLERLGRRAQKDGLPGAAR